MPTANLQENLPDNKHLHKKRGIGRPPKGQEPVDVRKALTLIYFKNKNDSEVARIMGVTRQAINQAIQPFRKLFAYPAETIMAYRENKSDIFDSVEFELLNDLVDKDKRAKASLNNVAYAFQQISNANRLEKGLSTDNISLKTLTFTLAELEQKEKELKEHLKGIGIEVEDNTQNEAVNDGNNNNILPPDVTPQNGQKEAFNNNEL